MDGGVGPTRRDDTPSGDVSATWRVRGEVFVTVKVTTQLPADMKTTTGELGKSLLQARAEECLRQMLETPDDDAGIEEVVVGYGDAEPRVEDFQLGYLED